MKTSAKIEQVARISANNDAEIGALIAEAMKKVTKEGVITIEEAKGTDTHIEVVEGMQFDRGYLSAYFVTNAEKMEVEMENPVHPHPRQKNILAQGNAAHFGSCRSNQPSVADYRRRSRR